MDDKKIPSLGDFHTRMAAMALKRETEAQKAARAEAIATVGIDKLDVHPGDVIVITCPPHDADVVVGNLRALLGDAYVYICLKPDTTLEAMDERAMLQAGWKKVNKRGRIHLLRESE